MTKKLSIEEAFSVVQDVVLVLKESIFTLDARSKKQEEEIKALKRRIASLEEKTPWRLK